jgi:DNA (cytosine-5)-methyltransferase 1
VAGDMADTASGGQREFGDASRPGRGGYADGGFWACDWLPCTDGKTRPIEPGTFPLAHGVQRRTSKLRAYGNAIVPQVAAEFIKAAENAMTPSTLNK